MARHTEQPSWNELYSREQSLPKSSSQEPVFSTVKSVEMRVDPALAQLPSFEPSLLDKLRLWINKGGLALLDQGLISGSNFILSMLLARWLTPESYGV